MMKEPESPPARRESIGDEPKAGPVLIDGQKKEKLFEADWWGIWERYRLAAAFFLGAVVLGLLAVMAFWPARPTIEIIPAEEETTPVSVFVDLAGAVERPGVYELTAGARINDLLIKAGGLSAQADRDWVAKNLNLAQNLTDGAKIYIPVKGEVGRESEVKGTAEVGPATAIAGKISLNSASLHQLDTLWGIGEKRASDIVANRPYQKIEELVEKKIVPQNVFDRIKDQITVY